MRERKDYFLLDQQIFVCCTSKERVKRDFSFVFPLFRYFFNSFKVHKNDFGIKLTKYNFLGPAFLQQSDIDYSIFYLLGTIKANFRTYDLNLKKDNHKRDIFSISNTFTIILLNLYLKVTYSSQML